MNYLLFLCWILSAAALGEGEETNYDFDTQIEPYQQNDGYQNDGNFNLQNNDNNQQIDESQAQKEQRRFQNIQNNQYQAGEQNQWLQNNNLNSDSLRTASQVWIRNNQQNLRDINEILKTNLRPIGEPMDDTVSLIQQALASEEIRRDLENKLYWNQQQRDEQNWYDDQINQKRIRPQKYTKTTPKPSKTTSKKLTTPKIQPQKLIPPKLTPKPYKTTPPKLSTTKFVPPKTQTATLETENEEEYTEIKPEVEYPEIDNEEELPEIETEIKSPKKSGNKDRYELAGTIVQTLPNIINSIFPFFQKDDNYENLGYSNSWNQQDFTKSNNFDLIHEEDPDLWRIQNRRNQQKQNLQNRRFLLDQEKYANDWWSRVR